MAEPVECRSDLDYADTPLAFQWEGQRLRIDEIVARWRTPQGNFFRVIAAGNQLFELFYDEVYEEWHIHLLMVSSR
jgi:hypothetical protein